MAYFFNLSRYKDGLLEDLQASEIFGKTLREVLVEFDGFDVVATVSLGMKTGYFVGSDGLKEIFGKKTKRVLLFRTVLQRLVDANSQLLEVLCPPPFKMDVKKKASHGWFDFPLMELSGMTLRQNLELFTGHSLIVQIQPQHTGKTLYFCGSSNLAGICRQKFGNGEAFVELLDRLQTEGSTYLNIPINFDDAIIFGTEDSVGYNGTAGKPEFYVPKHVSLHEGPSREAVREVKELPDSQMSFEDTVGSKEVDSEYQAGIQLFKNDDLDGALKHLQKALSLDPRHLPALSASGLVLREMGREKEALIQYQKATSIEGRHWKPWYEMGSLLLNLGRGHDAVEALERAYKLNKEDLVREKLANAYVEIGQFERASNLATRRAKRGYHQAA